MLLKTFVLANHLTYKISLVKMGFFLVVGLKWNLFKTNIGISINAKQILILIS
jgi:hypothetical protein